MSNKEDDSNRISALLTELSECREDERNAQNQILQLFSIVGTILGILFGVSYLTPTDVTGKIGVLAIVDASEGFGLVEIFQQINNYLTYDRIMFILSLLVFCAAFAYAVYLGMGNVLRYHYIKDLEKRLAILIEDSNDNRFSGTFFHWNTYSAPILTKNYKHIKSVPTILTYFFYIVAIICSILFSIGLVLALFLAIPQRSMLDNVLINSVIGGMVLTFILFLCVSIKASALDKYARKVSFERWKAEKEKSEQNDVNCFMKYLLYPRAEDLQKPLLIVLGFIFAVIFMGADINWMLELKELLVAILVFDVLAYQARFQINDIRGLKQDIDLEKNRAFCKHIKSNMNQNKRIVQLSFGVAILKIICSVIVTLLFGGEISLLLLFYLVALFVLTLIYEFCRSNIKSIWKIFFWVGPGYPLRFWLGFFVVIPFSWEVLCKQMLFFTIALWAYGSCAAILAWVNEVKEKYYKYPEIYSKIGRYKYINDTIRAEEQKRNGKKSNGSKHINKRNREQKFVHKIIPSRAAWDLAFCLSLFFVWLTVFIIEKVSCGIKIIELLICLFFVGVTLYAKNVSRAILLMFGTLGGVARIVISVIWGAELNYLLVIIMQMIIIITYLALYYRQRLKVNYLSKIAEMLWNTVGNKVIGKDTREYLNEEGNNK